MSIDLSSMPTLGFGMMRLPETGGKIDHEHVCRMVDLYMETGIRAGELMEAESFKINRRLERQKARKYVECGGSLYTSNPPCLSRDVVKSRVSRPEKSKVTKKVTKVTKQWKGKVGDICARGKSPVFFY